MGREITELIEDCLQFFRANRYAETTLGQYQRNWRRGILQYMKEKGETTYIPRLGADFIRERFSETDQRPTAREMVRIIRVLDDYLNLGYIRDKQVVPVAYSLYGEIGIQMQKLITHLQTVRKSSLTVDGYKRNLNRFFGYLNNVGVQINVIMQCFCWRAGWDYVRQI